MVIYLKNNKIEKAIETINTEKLDVYGLEIYNNLNLIYQHFWKEDIKYPIYSATKSFTSTIIGIAWDAKKISIDLPITNYFDEAIIKKIDKNKLSILRNITIENLLTMSVKGYSFRPYGKDWLINALNSSICFDSNTVGYYSNIPAYITGVICENAVGMPLIDFSGEYLFKRLDCPIPLYQTDPSGRFYGATGFKMRLSDFSKLGLLWLNNGLYNNNKILSTEWIEKSIIPHTIIKSEKYGYYVWVNDNYYHFKGKWGQNCIVVPQENIVVTYLSNVKEQTHHLQKIVLDSLI